MFTQVGSGRIIKDRRWSTKWRALSRWLVVCSAWSPVRCQRPATRTTTVPVTRRASSTPTTLHSSPTRPTSSLTTPGPGGVPTSAMSSKQQKCLLQWWNQENCVSRSYTTYVFIRIVHYELTCICLCYPKHIHDIYSSMSLTRLMCPYKTSC